MEECMSRKEKRKATKKMKRKQMRKEAAERKRQEEEDPDLKRQIALLEQLDAERMVRDRILFEERERTWLETIQLKQEQHSDSHSDSVSVSVSVSDEEEDPPQIIWQGNEIILNKKKHVPTSNPFPPESQQIQSVSVSPNFGTEQDKAHCPFHLKTGACRFGQRCSRVHFYPDKSSTLLIKNMYNGPSLLWDHDDALEIFILLETRHFRLACSHFNKTAVLSGIIQIFAHGAVLQTNGHDLQMV